MRPQTIWFFSFFRSSFQDAQTVTSSFNLVQYIPCRVQLIYADDLLAINADHQSVAPSQDPLQANGPLAQLQGQNSRSVNLTFRLLIVTLNNNLDRLQTTCVASEKVISLGLVHTMLRYLETQVYFCVFCRPHLSVTKTDLFENALQSGGI